MKVSSKHPKEVFNEIILFQDLANALKRHLLYESTISKVGSSKVIAVTDIAKEFKGRKKVYLLPINRTTFLVKISED